MEGVPLGAGAGAGEVPLLGAGDEEEGLFNSTISTATTTPSTNNPMELSRHRFVTKFGVPSVSVVEGDETEGEEEEEEAWLFNGTSREEFVCGLVVLLVGGEEYI